MSGPNRYEDERRTPASRAPGRGQGAALGGAEYAGAGLQLAVTIVAFMFLGIWLDKRLGTSPWLVILGVFLGAGTGFYSIYRKLTAAQQRLDAERQAARREREGKP